MNISWYNWILGLTSFIEIDKHRHAERLISSVTAYSNPLIGSYTQRGEGMDQVGTTVLVMNTRMERAYGKVGKQKSCSLSKSTSA